MNYAELGSVAEEFGGPLYVYDAEKIKFQYDRLSNAFSGVKNLKLNYATKALSNVFETRLKRLPMV